ncbi:hypothetical protein DUI87_14512 [Hirundo rustica rustica]|uniref:Uncharacterized protein n=1 Tax=Hirundo rustica rustica TaxID=333673 RepID=A0A3M0K6T9_HIRRU|nr:hypothetical protein DUI87_14512 [Hirundo rustica rustica]
MLGFPIHLCRDLPNPPHDVLSTAQEEPEQILTDPSGGSGSSSLATRSHLQMMNPTKAMTLAWGRAKGRTQPKGRGRRLAVSASNEPQGMVTPD